MKLVFLTDFDGTICKTFQSPPGGVGVIEVYELAIKAVFGPEGLALYHQQGGLSMRAPGETVSLLLEADARLSDRACQWYEQGGWMLFDSLVPEGLGSSIDWEHEPEKTAGECLVISKLDTLVAQIGTHNQDGTVWPALCAGFGTFWRWLHSWGEANAIDLVAGVVSSGHHAFISEAFRVNGLMQPQLLVTNDNTRAQPGDQSRLNKPHSELFGLINQVWLSEGDGRTSLQAQRSLFCGDDERTDIGFARNTGAVPFHFVPGADGVVYHDGCLVFGDWCRLVLWLERRTAQLQDGMPITDLAGAP